MAEMAGRLSSSAWLAAGVRGGDIERALQHGRGHRAVWVGGGRDARRWYPDELGRVLARIAEAHEAIATGRLWLWGRKGHQTAPLMRIVAGEADLRRLRFDWRKPECWWPPERRDGPVVRYYDVQLGPPETITATPAPPDATGEELPRQGTPQRRARLFFDAWKRAGFPKTSVDRSRREGEWNSTDCWKAAKALYPLEPLLMNLEYKVRQRAWAAAQEMPKDG